MKYKVGDKVRVREDLEEDEEYGLHIFDDEMEEYKGKQAIIKRVLNTCYALDIDNGIYCWTDEMLEPFAEERQFTKEDLRFGDIVTLRNGDTLIYTGVATMRNSADMEFQLNAYDDTDFYTGDDNLDIMRVQRYVNEVGFDTYQLKTLYYRKEILNEKEKEYLSAVIRPFRDRRFTISKILVYDKKTEFIFIEFSEDEYISFPYFKKGTMYKGMEVKKEYTLKELGL